MPGPGWQVGLGPFRTASGGRVTAALRGDSTTLGLDGARSVSFDCAGRLVRASWRGRSIRRGLDNRFVETRRTGRFTWSVARRDLGPAERTSLVEAIRDEVRAVRDGLAPREGESRALRDRLDAVLAWAPARLEAEAGRFAAVYRPVPILPPDQYRALVVQLTEGCAYNRCTFCGFYRGQPFRVKDAGQFSAHLAGVQAFFGGGLSLRRGVFLGDANALSLPTAQLRDALVAVGRSLPDHAAAGIASFMDVFSGRPKSRSELDALVGLGLHRVYLGLETGCDPLLAFLQKPATGRAVLTLVERLHAAGIRVGVIVLLGVGGMHYATRHVTETQRLLRAMRLGRGDLLYLSPLAADETSPYRRTEREAGIQAAPDEELDRQLRALRTAVPAGTAAGPKVAVYDVRDFLY